MTELISNKNKHTYSINNLNTNDNTDNKYVENTKHSLSDISDIDAEIDAEINAEIEYDLTN